MSSAGAGVAPIGVVIAVGGGVVLLVAGVAVLVAYAANQAAEGALRVVGHNGAAKEALAAAACEADRQALEWQAAAADVVGLNARLRLAAHRAEGAGVTVDLPPPLDLAGRSRDDAVRWAKDAERQLAVAQRALDTAATQAQWHALTTALPTRVGEQPDIAAALAGYRDTLRQRRLPDAAPARPGYGTDVEEILLRLDPDATTEEHTEVLQAAARVRTEPDRHNAAAYLNSLKRVVQEVNVRVANCRAAAEWLQALEQPTVSGAIIDADPPSPFTSTAAKLDAVFRGTAALTPELRAEGRAAVAWAFDITRMHYIKENLQSLFADAGYRIQEESSTHRELGFSVSHPDWSGEHSGRVRLTNDGKLVSDLVDEVKVSGDVEEARARARCDDFHGVVKSFSDSIPDTKLTVELKAERPRRYRHGEPPTTTVSRPEPKRRTR
jgi:hypothetical protein